MKAKTKIIFSFLILGGIFFFSGCGCKEKATTSAPISLEVWGIADDKDAYEEIFQNYQHFNSNVKKITYRKLTIDTYKKDLLEALAADKEPDIFMIQNNWLSEFKDKIAPAPQTILNEQKFRQDFVDVVAGDFLDAGNVYAVPLSVDSLGLYYNKDMFNAAGIVAPPTDWSEFVEDVKKMTVKDQFNQITQSGAALGTTKNINRPTDILTMLMFQNKTTMLDDKKTKALFDQGLAAPGKEVVFPGENALNFYTSFANPNSAYYSWNSSMHNSLDAFSEGNLGMMLNYSWHIATIKSKSPKLNFAVAPVPQITGNPPVNYANYWGYVIPKNKISTVFGSKNKEQIPNEARIAEAWKLLSFMATKPAQAATAAPANNGNAQFDPTKSYLTKTKKPAARRDLLELQKTDPNIGVFAQGNLIAKNWFQRDPETVENVFIQMIDSVNSGANTPKEALRTAVAQVKQTLK